MEWKQVNQGLAVGGRATPHLQPVFMASHKGRASEIKHWLRFIFGLKLKSKLSRVLYWSRNADGLFSVLEQAIATAIQFVADDTGEEVEGGMGSAWLVLR